MPHLVKGHMRFTDEDYLEQEFQAKAVKKYGSHVFQELTEALQYESIHLDNTQRYIAVAGRFVTKEETKRSLSEALLILTALVSKEGYSLTDLMKL
jgi:hypothetical protein